MVVLDARQHHKADPTYTGDYHSTKQHREKYESNYTCHLVTHNFVVHKILPVNPSNDEMT